MTTKNVPNLAKAGKNTRVFVQLEVGNRKHKKAPLPHRMPDRSTQLYHLTWDQPTRPFLAAARLVLSMATSSAPATACCSDATTDLTMDVRWCCSLLFSFNYAVDCIDERVVGCTDGKVLGWIDDHVKGCLIGRVDGCIVGTCCKGCAEGVTLGWLDGRRLGSTLGEVDTT